MIKSILEKYRKEKCLPDNHLFSEKEVIDILDSDKISIEKIDDIPLGTDSWKPFIKHITSERLVKLLYNGNRGLNERNGYWNRYYPIMGVRVNGDCPKATNEYPASMSQGSNSIFTLSCSLEHVLNMFNNTKVRAEKLFLKHFMFTYICEKRGYQNSTHIMSEAECKLDITMNGSNADRGIHQHLFQYWYFMTEVGYTWQEVIDAVKQYGRKSGIFQKHSQNIKIVIPYNKKHNKTHGWYKEMNMFTDEQLALPLLDFMDVLIDYLFLIKDIRAYPLENGVSKFDKAHKKSYDYDVWLNVNPMTNKVIVCKK